MPDATPVDLGEFSMMDDLGHSGLAYFKDIFIPRFQDHLDKLKSTPREDLRREWAQRNAQDFFMKIFISSPSQVSDLRFVISAFLGIPLNCVRYNPSETEKLIEVYLPESAGIPERFCQLRLDAEQAFDRGDLPGIRIDGKRLLMVNAPTGPKMQVCGIDPGRRLVFPQEFFNWVRNCRPFYRRFACPSVKNDPDLIARGDMPPVSIPATATPDEQEIPPDQVTLKINEIDDGGVKVIALRDTRELGRTIFKKGTKQRTLIWMLAGIGNKGISLAEVLSEVYGLSSSDENRTGVLKKLQAMVFDIREKMGKSKIPPEVLPSLVKTDFTQGFRMKFFAKEISFAGAGQGDRITPSAIRIRGNHRRPLDSRRG